jgi:preprotein translocase subunit SecF
MRTSVVVIAVLAWSLFLGIGGFALGYYMRGAAQVTKEAQTQDKEVKLKARKDGKALAVGIRTERAQAATDNAFQQIRANYETDQRKNPGAGCVLDADSLRRWNEANAQSDGDAASQPDGELPTPSESAAGGERGQ